MHVNAYRTEEYKELNIKSFYFEHLEKLWRGHAKSSKEVFRSFVVFVLNGFVERKMYVIWLQTSCL